MFDFFKRLFSLKPAPINRSQSGFRLLNVDQEASSLKVKARGNSDGIRDLPPADSIRLGEVENQIVELGREIFSHNHQHYSQEYQSYISRLNSLSPDGMLQKVQIETRNLVDQIEALPKKHSSRLDALQSAANETQRSFKLFKHDNGLEERAPDYPSSKILHGSVILVIFLVESMLNATLLAKGNELGLLGGWSEAIFISLINTIVAGFVLCLGIQSLYIKNTAKQIAGLILTISVVCGSIAFNLLVAHYRNALGGDQPEQASELALELMLASPLDLGNINSVMLLILGIAIVFFAGFDFLKMDDQYPGYGKAHRSMVSARKNLQNYIDWLIHEELEPVHSRARSIVSDHLALAASVKTEDQTIRERIKTLNANFDSSEKSNIEAINQLLDVYRQSNIKNRDAEAPTTFEREWQPELVIESREIPTSTEIGEMTDYRGGLEPLQDQMKSKHMNSLETIQGYAS